MVSFSVDPSQRPDLGFFTLLLKEQTQTLSETSIENKKDFALMPFEEDTLDYEHAVIDNFSKPVTDTVIISNKKQNEETTLFMKSSFTIKL